MRKVLFIVLIGISFISCSARGFARWDAGWKNDMNEQYKIQGADNRILSYDWYQDMYNQIQSQKANIEIETDFDAKKRMIMILNQNIGEYNSKACQYNRNIWKDRSLPYQIDYYKEEEK
jgi:hypothetical protein